MLINTEIHQQRKQKGLIGWIDTPFAFAEAVHGIWRHDTRYESNQKHVQVRAEEVWKVSFSQHNISVKRFGAKHLEILNFILNYWEKINYAV